MFWKGGHLWPVVTNGRWSHVEVRLQEVNSVQLVPVLVSISFLVVLLYHSAIICYAAPFLFYSSIILFSFIDFLILVVVF